MPIVPNFSTSQPAGAISSVTFTDTSTGSDVGLSGRTISLIKYQGDALVPTDYTVEYIAWPIGSTSITITDLLDKDYAAEITVLWFSGSTISYSKTILTLFSAYSELFLRQLTQALAANKELITRQNYWQNKIKLRTLIEDAGQAVALLNDQTIATFCLVEAKKLTDNISTFF